MDKTTGEYDFTRLETVVFGVGKVEALGWELSRRGAKRALIVTGKTLGQSKLADQVKSAAGNALAGVFTGAAQHVPSQTVTELVAEARRVGADAMVSFGGGSPIDTVKNAAWQLMGGRAGSRTIDFSEATADKAGGGDILHVAIPTTLSAGEFTPAGGADACTPKPPRCWPSGPARPRSTSRLRSRRSTTWAGCSPKLAAGRSRPAITRPGSCRRPKRPAGTGRRSTTAPPWMSPITSALVSSSGSGTLSSRPTIPAPSRP